MLVCRLGVCTVQWKDIQEHMRICLAAFLRVVILSRNRRPRKTSWAKHFRIEFTNPMSIYSFIKQIKKTINWH